MMTDDSIEKRFFYKTASNLFNLGTGLLKVTIVPRILGPIAFGQFGFMRATFSSVVEFFSLSTSKAFFNYNSKNKNSYAAVVFYSWFSLILAVLFSLGLALVLILGLNNVFFPEITLRFIVLGATLGMSRKIFSIVTEFADSKGESVLIEKIKVLFRLFEIILLLGLVFTKTLDLTTYFLLSILIPLSTSLYALRYYRARALMGEGEQIDLVRLKTIGQYFYTFCAPLFVYSLFSMAYDLFDRWFLQIIGGSEEQGYYQLGFNLASIAILIVSAMSPIFMRELSKAHGEENRDRMKEIFSKYSRMIYTIVAVICIFLSFYARDIVVMFAGKEYRDANRVLFVMALYPLNVVFGQLNGSLFFATERTAEYRNRLMLMMLVGIPITYLLIAPKDFVIPGLAMGALGLSLKKFCTQFFIVNALTFFSTRYLKIRYLPFLYHQIFIVTVLFLILGALTSVHIIPVSELLPVRILAMVVNGMIYMIIVGALLYWKPALLGLEKREIIRWKNKTFKRLGFKAKD